MEVEKVKSTLILCYGQVALNAPPEKILNRIDQDILRSISKHFNTKVFLMETRSIYILQQKRISEPCLLLFILIFVQFSVFCFF